MLIEKYSCECGSIITNKAKNRHLNTSKHLNFMNNKLKLDDNQLLFINSPIQNAILIGNPGCGKTKTIIEYCIHKYNNNLIQDSSNFFIISFSKKAQLDFITRSKKSTIPEIFNKNNVRTIHSLAASIFYKLYNKKSSSVNSIIVATYKNLLNENNFYIQILENCKFIIVDEAQDLSENQYNLLNLLSIKLNIPLILVGDPNQNIYQFQGGNDKFLLNHETKNVFNLIHNYRSSQQIIDFCNQIRPNNTFPEMICGTNNMNNKPLIFCNTIDKIKKHIIHELTTNRQYELHEIAIIGPVKKSMLSCPNTKSMLSFQNKYVSNVSTGQNKYVSTGLQLICNLLHENKISFIKHFTDPGDIDGNSNKQFTIKQNHVNIITSHGSKGLEFKKTLVINYHTTTQSKKPTQKEYEEFKYLWYVSLSRAKYNLIIYVDCTKYIFWDFFNINKKYYKLFTPYNLGHHEKPKHNVPILPKSSITDIISDNNYFNDNTFYEFNEKFKYTIEKIKLYNIDDIDDILEHYNYSCLYGLFIEKLFMFYYYKNKNDINTFITLEKTRINNIIIMPESFRIIFYHLQNKNIINSDKSVYIPFLDNININLSSKEHEFISILKKESKNKSDFIKVYIENDLFVWDQTYLFSLYDSLLLNNNNENIIFTITLYLYQVENECKYMLKYDFSQHLLSLSNYFIKLDNLTKNYNDFYFQVLKENIHINLVGVIDILHINKIIELKFIQEINEKHIIQVLLYYNNYSINWEIKKDIEIWNLLDGYKYCITFNDNFTNWDLNCFMCKILNIKMKNNIFMLDIETNTINPTIDFTNPTNVEIIDRFVYEYNFNCTVSNGLIKNKYNLTTSHINNITLEDLKYGDDDLTLFKQDMDNINKYCLNPLFIAHNGNRFDFKILIYFDLLNKTNKLLNSLIFFPLYSTNKKKKLIDLYNNILNCNIVQTHRAKEDTMMIVQICNKLKLSYQDIYNMLEN